MYEQFSCGSYSARSGCPGISLCPDLRLHQSIAVSAFAHEQPKSPAARICAYITDCAAQHRKGYS